MVSAKAELHVMLNFLFSNKKLNSTEFSLCRNLELNSVMVAGMCNSHNNLYHMPWLEIKTKQTEISSERDQQPQSNRLNSTGLLLQAQNYRLSEVVVCADELG